MKRGIKILILLGIILLATVSNLFSADTSNFFITEIPIFDYHYTLGTKLLQMDYASYFIQNPEVWKNESHLKTIYQVDIIFTKYPFHKKDWITNYDSLLSHRIKAICALEPTINPSKIKWNLVLQTNCKTEAEAKNLFHGALLHYIEQPASIASHITPIAKTEEIVASSNIDELMSGNYQFPDSTVYKVLERNEDWKNILFVTDWTASMYQFGAQAALWYNNALQEDRVSQFVFFNDGDNKKIKKIGKTGGIYFCKPNQKHIVQVMKKVQKNGQGGDCAENDLEAIITGINKCKSFTEVVLIADNKSPVKDIALLSQIKVPVHIIVCGCKRGQTIRHDYLQIASSTDGSVHTIDEDICNLSEIKEGEKVTIQDVDYQRVHGRIVKTKPKNFKTHL
jgi:hypothetical protein